MGHNAHATMLLGHWPLSQNVNYKAFLSFYFKLDLKNSHKILNVHIFGQLDFLFCRYILGNILVYLFICIHKLQV